MFGFTKIYLLVIICLSALFTGCNGRPTNQAEKHLTIYAAASLTDVLSELIDSFEVNHPIKIDVNFASSGTLARQIEQGELPDIYLSASKRWIDYIDSLGYVANGKRKVFMSNRLVLAAPITSEMDSLSISNTLDLVSLLGDDRLSIGDPLHVPVGMYAKQSMNYYWDYELFNKKLLPGKDARSVLMVIELGETPLGIVYKTDAIKSSKVKVVATFPNESHSNIVYVAAMCKEGEDARAFYNFLSTEKAEEIALKYGFDK